MTPFSVSLTFDDTRIGQIWLRTHWHRHPIFFIHISIYFYLQNGNFFKNHLSRHVSLTFVYCFCWQSSISWNRVEKMLLKTKHLDADMVSQIYSLVLHSDLRVRIDHCFSYKKITKKKWLCYPKISATVYKDYESKRWKIFIISGLGGQKISFVISIICISKFNLNHILTLIFNIAGF